MKSSQYELPMAFIHKCCVCLVSLLIAGCTTGRASAGTKSGEKSKPLIYVHSFLLQAGKSKIHVNMSLQQLKAALAEASIPGEPIKRVEDAGGFSLYTLPLAADESGRWSAKIVFLRDRLDYFSISRAKKSLYERFYCGSAGKELDDLDATKDSCFQPEPTSERTVSGTYWVHDSTMVAKPSGVASSRLRFG